ncbi:MAG: hypothetical protein ABI132_10230 [Rhodanobacteraceae bacterium]
MKRTHSMMTLTAAMMFAAAPLAFAQSTSSTQDTGMQHPTSGAMTHTPMTSPPATNSNESGSMQSGSMQNEKNESNMSSSSMGTGQEMGVHTMSGTVTEVKSDNLVYVISEGMKMRVHFPDASQHLKKGDKVTLHLGYSIDSTPGSM